MGTPAFAVPTLNALAERPDLCQVVAVVTQPDKPVGRHQELQPSAMKIAAQARGIAVLQPSKMRAPETETLLRSYSPDIAIVAAYGRILPKNLLDVPKIACVNVHASLLPKFRGASPIAHAILTGDQETGVALMKMDEGLDTGDVYCSAKLSIAADDTTGSLTPKLAKLGAQLLVDNFLAIVSGKLLPTPQDSTKATLAPPLHREDGKLDFRKSAQELERRVRAMQPWPGTFFLRNGDRIQVHRAHVVEHHCPTAGTVVAADNQGVVIACSHDVLALDEVTPAGRKKMPASSWAVGRGIGVNEIIS